MTPEKGGRSAVPLSGKAPISGDLRVVVDKDVVRLQKTQADFPHLDAGALAGLDDSEIISTGYTEAGRTIGGNI